MMKSRGKKEATNFSMTTVSGLPSSVTSFPSVRAFNCCRSPDITRLCIAYAILLFWILGWKTCIIVQRATIQNASAYVIRNLSMWLKL